MATIERQVFGDRRAVAERSAKPAWVQIEEQLADCVESRRLAPGHRLPAERDLRHVAGFTQGVERQGLEAGAQALAAGEQRAPEPVAELLGLERGAPVVRLERVRLGGDQPVALEDSWLRGERFPELLGHDLSGSLYAPMREHDELAPVSAIERLEPVAARPHEAAALGIPEASTLMLVERARMRPTAARSSWHATGTAAAAPAS